MKHLFKSNLNGQLKCLIIAFLLSFTSCGQKEVLPNALTIKLKAEGNGTSVKVSAIADSVTYLVLESREESLYTNIDKLIQDADKNYYILDKKGVNGIVVFDQSGKFLYKIVHQGKGPGEYSAIEDFAVFNNEIIEIYDNSTGKMIQYDKRGKYLKEIPYEKGYNEFYHVKDTLGFFTSCGGYCPDMYTLVNSKKKEFFKSNYKDFLYSGDRKFYINGDLQFVTTTFDNKIYTIHNGEPKEYITIDFGKDAIALAETDPQKLKDNYPNSISVGSNSDKNLFFTYINKGAVINVFYNFLTKQSYSGSTIDNDINYIPIGRPVSSIDDTIITTLTIDQSQGKGAMDYMATQPADQRGKFEKLTDLYSNISPLGKQVLVFYHLK